MPPTDSPTTSRTPSATSPLGRLNTAIAALSAQVRNGEISTTDASARLLEHVVRLLPLIARQWVGSADIDEVTSRLYSKPSFLGFFGSQGPASGESGRMDWTRSEAFGGWLKTSVVFMARDVVASDAARMCSIADGSDVDLSMIGSTAASHGDAAASLLSAEIRKPVRQYIADATARSNSPRRAVRSSDIEWWMGASVLHDAPLPVIEFIPKVAAASAASAARLKELGLTELTASAGYLAGELADDDFAVIFAPFAMWEAAKIEAVLARMVTLASDAAILVDQPAEAPKAANDQAAHFMRTAFTVAGIDDTQTAEQLATRVRLGQVRNSVLTSCDAAELSALVRNRNLGPVADWSSLAISLVTAADLRTAPGFESIGSIARFDDVTLIAWLNELAILPARDAAILADELLEATSTAILQVRQEIAYRLRNDAPTRFAREMDRVNMKRAHRALHNVSSLAVRPLRNAPWIVATSAADRIAAKRLLGSTRSFASLPAGSPEIDVILGCIRQSDRQTFAAGLSKLGSLDLEAQVTKFWAESEQRSNG